MWNLCINGSDEEEWISDFLIDREALSVGLVDAGDQPLFQEGLYESPVWKKIRINALFAEKNQALAAIETLKTVLDRKFEHELEEIQQQNWVQLTQRQFSPRCFADRLWIVPAWEEGDSFSGAVLRIEPGLGFGTGSHPTTALCLDWLAQQELSGKTVLDYGCGSGILGLAALTLGAQAVWAIDHDPQALAATGNNAALNLFSEDALHIVFPEQLPNIKADIILANILANPLCELAPHLIERLQPSGVLVLSGFLEKETDRVIEAYQPILQLIDKQIRDDWVRAVLKARRNS